MIEFYYLHRSVCVCLCSSFFALSSESLCVSDSLALSSLKSDFRFLHNIDAAIQSLIKNK